MRSLLVWGLTWLYMTAAGVVSLPTIWITGRLDFTYRAARLGLRLLFRLAGVRVRVEGRELLPPPQTGAPAPIYMANHQSNLDPPILVSQLPGAIAFLPKKELFSIPILGSVLRVGGLIPVDRKDRAAARASISRAAEAVRAGRPFLIFPEGTRSPDGGLLDFKKGPFYLAEQAQAAVVPVRVEGSGALMPRGHWRIRPGTVTLRIQPPILPASWSATPEPRAHLAATVRTRLLPR